VVRLLLGGLGLVCFRPALSCTKAAEVVHARGAESPAHHALAAGRDHRGRSARRRGETCRGRRCSSDSRCDGQPDDRVLHRPQARSGNTKRCIDRQVWHHEAQVSTRTACAPCAPAPGRPGSRPRGTGCRTRSPRRTPPRINRFMSFPRRGYRRRERLPAPAGAAPRPDR